LKGSVYIKYLGIFVQFTYVSVEFAKCHNS